MVKDFGNLLLILFFLIYDSQSVDAAIEVSQKQKINGSGIINLQQCEGGVMYINSNSCNEHVIAEKIGEMMRNRLKVENNHEREFFICHSFQPLDISMNPASIPAKYLGCRPLNISKTWFPQDNTKSKFRYGLKSGNKTNCFVLVCISLVPKGSDMLSKRPPLSHSYYTICKKYDSSEIVLAVCVFYVVLASFTLFHDYVVMRIALFLAFISLPFVFSENSWLPLTFLSIFILLFIFTGAKTRAKYTKSFIFFMQTYTAMFPPLLKGIDKLYTALRFSSLHFTTLPCIFQESLINSKNSRQNSLICSFCAPLIALLIITFFILFKRLLKKYIGSAQNDVSSLKNQFFFALVFVAYYSFFNASILAFKTFNNYSIRETETQLAVFGLIAFALLPIAVFASLLHRYRNSLNDEGVLSWLGYLYKSYMPDSDYGRSTKWHYYEIYFMCFRILLSLPLTLIQPDWKYLVAILVLIIMAIFYYKLTPFTDIWANFVILVPIFSLIIINLFLYILPLRNPYIERDLITIVLGVTLSFYVRIIVRPICRQTCINIKSHSRRQQRPERSDEESRRLLPNGGTSSRDAGYSSIRVLQNIIPETPGAEIDQEALQGQSSSYNLTDQCQEENIGRT